MQRDEVLNWLRETDPQRLETLWQRADDVRRRHVGPAVYLRGLIEISNHCVRSCAYCGLRAPNTSLARYRMTIDEVLTAARAAASFDYGTVVLQAGEDPQLTEKWVADLVRRIKNELPVAVTLSLGEQNEQTLATWREAGADRYLLRFETSNRTLYDRIHPPRPGRTFDRLALLNVLRDLGYEVGSGVMIGIPGQTFDSLADDIEWFRRLDLDMIGVGPYIAHPDTPLAQAPPEPVADQVPADELMTYKVLALARLVCPFANIPSTTALATLNKESGRELGLSRGANVVMPNATPPEYRCLYEIYPDKACLNETAECCQLCLRGRIESMERTVGTGRGDSPNRRRRDVSPTGAPSPGGAGC
ncbi:MAG: [FeFe] hydrogenase H-cluster radical SAM maturase HydE [Phycisphaerae bacterium]|jgi:biotin synthase